MCDETSSLTVCPYCDELVGADAIQYGAERMHPACYEAFGRDMEEPDVSKKEIASV